MEISAFVPLSRPVHGRAIVTNELLMSVDAIMNTPRQERTETVISIAPDSKLTRASWRKLSKSLYHELLLNLVEYDDKAPTIDWPWTDLVTLVFNFISRVHEYVTDKNVLSAISSTKTPHVIGKRIIRAISECAFEGNDRHMCPLHGVRGHRISTVSIPCLSFH